MTPSRLDPAAARDDVLPGAVEGRPQRVDRRQGDRARRGRIVPLVSERRVVKFRGDARDKIVARWRRVAAEANGQCRRTYDVVIDEPVHVARRARRRRRRATSTAVGDWIGRAPRSPSGPKVAGRPGSGRPSDAALSLGPTVLRAETAGRGRGVAAGASAGGWGFASAARHLGNDESNT